jgi:hypothetical protein
MTPEGEGGFTAAFAATGRERQGGEGRHCLFGKRPKDIRQ